MGDLGVIILGSMALLCATAIGIADIVTSSGVCL